KTANIDVFDVFGKLVLHKKDFESGYIDISNSLNGTYFMKIQFGDRIETHKIILQK
ncbi:MAG: T9SS type A sorting domain-containing protein, partial [Bacteroidales bacterium]|nr:T9SS type A sorting domain-containing protein [Bacteroidales bacterium]